ncbi:hypothetical protein PIB30_065878 [Stylosanthes scabra]|uniref:Uncharacterized protein n=1 Tax=Stylosanthes scabra TaxID=79078 RepID=A0ABU6UQT0_9FABA|nr:hypothetical protein [Stylosanthes scabra]
MTFQGYQQRTSTCWHRFLHVSTIVVHVMHSRHGYNVLTNEVANVSNKTNGRWHFGISKWSGALLGDLAGLYRADTLIPARHRLFMRRVPYPWRFSKSQIKCSS